ncbi:hypothetical protein KYT24_004394 [Salmonella enterica]|nr:hypothetical protein [Salmonella enterica]
MRRIIYEATGAAGAGIGEPVFMQAIALALGGSYYPGANVAQSLEKIAEVLAAGYELQQANAERMERIAVALESFTIERA